MKPVRTLTLGSIVLTGLISLGTCACIAVFAGMFFFLFRSHSVYTQAVALAKNDPDVIDVFGVPVSDGFFVAGEISESSGSGSASLSTSLSGPGARGRMDILGSKEGSQWRVTFINIYVDGQRLLFYDSDEAGLGFQRVE